MARWGEGDPRWIVEERPDATNVNNWHWSEKNASGWSREQFKNIFNNLTVVADKIGTLSLSFNNCEGEAMVNNRKGKLIFFYEWTVKLDWTATPDAEPEVLCKGEVDILNLSEENEPHEIDISISVSSGGEQGEKFKQFIHHQGVHKIRDALAQYIKALKQEYASDVILPTKTQGHVKDQKTYITKSVEAKKNTCQSDVKKSTGSGSKSTAGVPLETCVLQLSQNFKCTAEELYRALTIREMVVAFTQNSVKMETIVGGDFELFGGNICGKFTELVPDKKICKKWRFKQWPEGHMSEVVLTITQEEEETRLDLEQRGVPKNDFDRTRSGWLNYYFESIKRTFGFGALLF